MRTLFSNQRPLPDHVRTKHVLTAGVCDSHLVSCLGIFVGSTSPSNVTEETKVTQTETTYALLPPADDSAPPSLVSDTTSEEIPVRPLASAQPPRVTFSERVRITSGIRGGKQRRSTSSSSVTQPRSTGTKPKPSSHSHSHSRPRRISSASSPRDRLIYAAELASSLHEGGISGSGISSPSPSRSRSSSTSASDSASSFSVPLRPPSLVTPHAYASSYHRPVPQTPHS